MTSNGVDLQQQKQQISPGNSPQLYQNNNNNTSCNKNNNSAFYNFPYDETSEQEKEFFFLQCKSRQSADNNFSYISLPTEDTSLLEKSCQINSNTRVLLHKSNSYSGELSAKTKSSALPKQESINERISSCRTDSELIYGSVHIQQNLDTPNSGSSPVSISADPDEYEPFLMNSSENNETNGSVGGDKSPRRGGLRKSHNSRCLRMHAFINRNWYLSYLVPLSILLALMFVAYVTRDYAKRLLYWIETQNPWVIFSIFMVLFVIVSFPVVVGYFVLMITSGYLFGFLRGFLTVILGANVGIAVAHYTIRSFRHRIPIHRIIKNETGRAILRVISGPRAFRVVLFTRLTPIPFGIQNAIFGVSSINPKVYHSATVLGLLPAQLINVYLGSTLRSMHEVLNTHGTAVTGYITFGVEVICGVALMFWVVQKARKELSETLLSDISNEGKLIDIQV